MHPSRDCDQPFRPAESSHTIPRRPTPAIVRRPGWRRAREKSAKRKGSVHMRKNQREKASLQAARPDPNPAPLRRLRARTAQRPEKESGDQVPPEPKPAFGFFNWLLWPGSHAETEEAIRCRWQAERTDGDLVHGSAGDLRNEFCRHRLPSCGGREKREKRVREEREKGQENIFVKNCSLDVSVTPSASI